MGLGAAHGIDDMRCTWCGGCGFILLMALFGGNWQRDLLALTGGVAAACDWTAGGATTIIGCRIVLNDVAVGTCAAAG